MATLDVDVLDTSLYTKWSKLTPAQLAQYKTCNIPDHILIKRQFAKRVKLPLSYQMILK